MKKNKQNKNKNVLSRLSKEINKKANPIFNRKSQVENYDDIERKAQEHKTKYKSNLEGNDLNEYFDLANLSNKKYEILSEQIALQSINTVSIQPINQSNNILLSNTLKNSEMTIDKQQIQFLSIPKRPKWHKGIDKETFSRMEKESFLTWRKALAEEEEKRIDMSITPFEKNMEIWKQLWLVVEKSEILFQIVDGRNPLYFRCPDLDKYIKEVNPQKESILIVNKADLMSKDIRKNWADYFKTNGIKFIFFSALEELDKMEKNLIDEEEIEQTSQKEEEEYKIYNRKDLILFMKKQAEQIKSNLKEKEPESKQVSVNFGFIGYPNVGKSSIINVLMKKKKVGVACMPGKTKHYQTLFLPVETLTNNYSINEKEICLMDCPGLVFPSFTSSKADMLVNGIYPIDQIKDYHSPIQIIILRLPAKILNNFYGIQLPDLYSAKQFLQILSEKRGFYTGNALPDEARTAKLVLRDYVTGKLLYCYLRPDYTKEKFGFISPYMDNELTGEENEKHKMLAGIPATFDDHYEKLYYEQEELLENKNVKSGKNFDDEFFQKEIVQHAENEDTGSKLISKDMKRELKFAMKRGEITEDEYDSVETVAEFKQLMERINKEKGNDKNSKNIIKTQAVNF